MRPVTLALDGFIPATWVRLSARFVPAAREPLQGSDFAGQQPPVQHSCPRSQEYKLLQQILSGVIQALSQQTEPSSQHFPLQHTCEVSQHTSSEQHIEESALQQAAPQHMWSDGQHFPLSQHVAPSVSNSLMSQHCPPCCGQQTL